MQATDIFRPNDYPEHTYVSRDDELDSVDLITGETKKKIDTRLERALKTPGLIISISGPSKSGKTVLIEKVVGAENLLTVTGAGVDNSNDIWDRVLDQLEQPNTKSISDSSTISETGKVEASGKAKLPFFDAGGGGSYSSTDTRTDNQIRLYSRGGLQQIIKLIANTQKVLFIDDFHYMQPEIQSKVAKEIKEAARLGVKICTASVPHRSDDVVRSNPELRGRVKAIDIKPWSKDDLIKIAEIGFPLLGVELDPEVINKLAEEASQSPQLMQTLCLQACFEKEISITFDPHQKISISKNDLNQIFREASSSVDFSTLLKIQHSGPRTRGTERKEFQLIDDSRGDVYRALLLAIKQDPPLLSFQYNEISKRIQRVCSPDFPQAASLTTACSQIAKFAKELHPNQRIIDWDGEPASILSIEDPYYLFYLRWSNKLKELQNSCPI